MREYYPVVLSFSGHDPSGGAGIQADIESLVNHKCHACCVITTLTEQDSSNVKKLIPQKSKDIIDQANTIFNDFQVQAIKIGLLGNHKIASEICTILLQHPDIPVVLDPILASSNGTSLADERLINCIVKQLLPCTTVLTPNIAEARILTKHNILSVCGSTLLQQGPEYVLITGTDDDKTDKSDIITNQLFQKNGKTKAFYWDRLPESYHGSGCTLASSISALIAQGLPYFKAITQAQYYTWNTLSTAYKAGKGQLNPNRLFCMEKSS